MLVVLYDLKQATLIMYEAPYLFWLPHRGRPFGLNMGEGVEIEKHLEGIASEGLNSGQLSQSQKKFLVTSAYFTVCPPSQATLRSTPTSGKTFYNCVLSVN